jgi:Kip1 ubiquitination-promoting complex protein 1
MSWRDALTASGLGRTSVVCAAVLQIGWATLHCPFTAEEGVGDAADSYAVDGKRQR